jgi:hypothetical protein
MAAGPSNYVYTAEGVPDTQKWGPGEGLLETVAKATSSRVVHGGDISHCCKPGWNRHRYLGRFVLLGVR